jgi:rare lipoprotein A
MEFQALKMTALLSAFGQWLVSLICAQVRVTYRRSGRSVVVRINDRGPFVRGRVIDVTPAAARALGFSGLAPVTLDVIDRRG